MDDDTWSDGVKHSHKRTKSHIYLFCLGLCPIPVLLVALIYFTRKTHYFGVRVGQYDNIYCTMIKIYSCQESRDFAIPVIWRSSSISQGLIGYCGQCCKSICRTALRQNMNFY